MDMTSGEAAFAGYGLASQVVLVAFFAARRWWPLRAGMLGAIAYGWGGLGALVGLVLLLTGNGSLAPGPLLMAAWALLGALVDVWRPRPWRGPPVEWAVLLPYLGVYFFAQMFLWWPLWTFARPAWAVFLVLFAISTALNIQGHRRPATR